MQIDSIKDTGKSSRTLADFEKIQESPSIESVLKMSAKSAACAPGARVRVHGLQQKTEFNNCLGTVKGAVDGGRVCVLLDGEAGHELSIKPENFSLEAEGALPIFILFYFTSGVCCALPKRGKGQKSKASRAAKLTLARMLLDFTCFRPARTQVLEMKRSGRQTKSGRWTMRTRIPRGQRPGVERVGRRARRRVRHRGAKKQENELK
jgi:hypothetical protein